MSTRWESEAEDAERSSRFVSGIELAYEIRVGDVDAGELSDFEELVLFAAWPPANAPYPPAGHGYPRRDA
ncbi:hypothetical protein [Streptomyces galbus]|uniref:Uncharacterized protein n=1 Tax=Streptomyces galbus TaxID=33898 RepID=A0ABX1IQY2_STRGB|nr:hypothetical protein [Streptomyces galbus]NKQ28036.1 hypothetical protein [Streptomyces galbus]